MEDEKLNGLFGQPQVIFVGKDDANMHPLPVVTNSVEFGKIEHISLPKEKFSWDIELNPEQFKSFQKLFEAHPQVKKAQNMIKSLQSEVREFNTNPPKNRIERRKRERELKKKINKFTNHCKRYNLKLERVAN